MLALRAALGIQRMQRRRRITDGPGGAFAIPRNPGNLRP